MSEPDIIVKTEEPERCETCFVKDTCKHRKAIKKEAEEVGIIAWIIECKLCDYR